MPELEDLQLQSLGRRIMICGPSSAGKSTLAVALAQKLGVPAIHLDQLHHQPGPNWVPRPADEFTRLHDEAVKGDFWVIEGNYSRLFPTRLARATGIILLGSQPWRALFRYVRRTLFERDRPGHLDGAQDRLRWLMVRHILIQQPRNREKTIAALTASGLPFIRLATLRDLNVLYAHWGLARPSVSRR